MSRKDFVLEIGTEELPPAVVSDFQYPLHARSLFECITGNTELVSQKLVRNIYATPRRIIIHIKDFPSFYNKLEKGPPKKIAYDKNGNSTKALKGFLKKIEATENDITKIPEDNNEKIAVLKKFSTKDLVIERIKKVIKYFVDYKTMSWDANSDIKFPRPIRWILALYGEEIIPINVDGVAAGNITYGHHLFSTGSIKVKNAQDFFKKLRKNRVIYDFKERRDKIDGYLKRKHWHKNPQLLDEVAGLVECPEFIEGIYDKKYLNLPKEVLIASMSKNQRIFPLENKMGNFINKFVAVTNGNRKNTRIIKRHYEQVLDAKLKDALFFYNEDLKGSLAERTKLLKNIIFHKKLGSYADKIERIKKLIDNFKDTFKLTDIEYEKIVKASTLCKVDLLTQMVGEFPSLQGAMGKYYAIGEGIDKEVACAIEEHYRPRFYEDKLPKTKLGIILALLDKFDSVICHFKAGHQPKGNWDLYALRRLILFLSGLSITTLDLPV